MSDAARSKTDPTPPAARATSAGARPPSELYHRHTLPVRLLHWINVLSLTVLLMSGMMIFNAHPALDWGKSSYTGRPSVFEITTRDLPGGAQIGVTRLFSHELDTTGVLGLSAGPNASVVRRAFPSWMTIPGHYSLAEGRLWHFSKRIG